MSETAAPRSNLKHRALELLLKSLLSFFGVAILAIGAMLCKVGNAGLDPFTALNLGVSARVHLSLGIYQLLTNCVIILIVLLLDIKKIGIGTIINMVFAGFMIDWFSTAYNAIFHYQPSLMTSIINGILGLLFFTLGTSLYMGANLGVAPYDALAPIASKRLHIKYKFCRVVQDIAFMIAALIAGGPIGLATLFISFFAGPLITFWNHGLTEKLMAQLVSFSQAPSGKSIGRGIDNAGKFTYHLVKNGYDQTVLTQEKLSQYSDEQLEEKVEQAKQTLQQTDVIRKHTFIRYGLLKKEERRRKDKKTQGPDQEDDSNRPS
ncbi:MAG: YitT family protein [Sporolactobacillus sp.]